MSHSTVERRTRKQAVVLHRMLADGTTFVTEPVSEPDIAKEGKSSVRATTSRPEHVPSPGTMGLVRPQN
jgi:hypothetical protein